MSTSLLYKYICQTCYLFSFANIIQKQAHIFWGENSSFMEVYTDILLHSIFDFVSRLEMSQQLVWKCSSKAYLTCLILSAISHCFNFLSMLATWMHSSKKEKHDSGALDSYLNKLYMINKSAPSHYRISIWFYFWGCSTSNESHRNQQNIFPNYRFAFLKLQLFNIEIC